MSNHPALNLDGWIRKDGQWIHPEPLISPVVKTGHTVCVAPTPFAARIAEFQERISKQNREATETKFVVMAHIAAMKRRISDAESNLTNLNHGSAAAHLRVAMRDLEAALEALPKV